MPEEFIITKDGNKDVKNTNPTHENWVALDQQVISFLLSSIKSFSLASQHLQKYVATTWNTIEHVTPHVSKPHDYVNHKFMRP
jgi:hypothetical protein